MISRKNQYEKRSVPDPGSQEHTKSAGRPSQYIYEIFRPEAIATFRNKLGAPVKPLSTSTKMITIFFLLLLLSALLFISSVKISRKELILGEVVPTQGSIILISQYDGFVEGVAIKEGGLVNAGQEIMAISSNATLSNGDGFVDSLRTAQALQQLAAKNSGNARVKLLENQIAEVETRNNGLSADIDRLQSLMRVLGERKRLQVENAGAHSKLADQGMLSMVALRQQQDIVLAIQQQIGQTEREIALQRNQLHQSHSQIARIHDEIEIAQQEAVRLDAQLNEQSLKFNADHSGKIVSPVDGVVTSLSVIGGSSVSREQKLGVIVPRTLNAKKDTLEVILWAPSKAIGFVRPGNRVRVMYDAFPYQTFGVGNGIVTEVSATPLLPTKTAGGGTSGEEQFRIRVTLADAGLVAFGKEWPLKPGMRVSADVILEEQTILGWILNPVNASVNRHFQAGKEK